MASEPSNADVAPTTLYTSNGAGVATRVSSTNPVPTSGAAPLAANILTGYQTFAATTGATTLITVPAGRTWVGTVGLSCAVGVAAASSTAGQARGVIPTAGTGVTPAAGSVVACEAKAGANAATGTVGTQNSTVASMPLTVIAPAGNAVTVTVVTTQAGTASVVDASASGQLI